MPKLLIIDDESDIREFTRSYFEKRGFEVFAATNGQEGLEIIYADNPDLVLLDVRMQGMSGIEVLQELRAKNLQPKVIIITGLEDSELTDRAQALGIVDFVHKPLILGDLERIVIRHLGK
jgi:two-component system, response regulator, stage 0 sporulation protein F